MKKYLWLVIFCLSVPFTVWGWAYEYSYFRVLGLNVYENLGFVHFIISAATSIVPMVLIFIVISSVWKFFSKELEKNDWEEFKDKYKSASLSDVVVIAKSGVVLSFIFWCLVLMGFNFGQDRRLGYNFWLMIFINFAYFFPSFYISQTHSKLPIIIMLIISVAFCFSAGGMDAARSQRLSNNTIRDDAVVKIYRIETQIKVEKKNWSVPVLKAERLIEKIMEK
ncbi:MAG: hypothetical protein LWW74_08875 [Burkholderiales bacterium]|nr:hypothetical protein [Burkholderiales bacterium]